MASKKRGRISVRTRFAVFSRDNFKCRYCGRGQPETKLVLDHLIPVAAGGVDEEENLVTACDQCNAGKSASLLAEGSCPAVTEQTLEELRVSVERQRELAKLQQERRALLESDRWEFMCAWTDAFGGELTKREDGTESLRCNIAFPADVSITNALRESPLDELLDALAVTHGRWESGWVTTSDCIRYFFGCVRGMRHERLEQSEDVQ